MRSSDVNELGVTVLICTYNGEERLKPTLEHLLAQEGMKSNTWEVIVVDNNSTDASYERASNILQKGKVSFKVLKEPRQGKSHALKTGFNNARYEFVLICDDDNRLSPDYLEKGYKILVANPKIGALGGKGIAEFEGAKPTWFDQYCSSFAVGPQYHDSGKISNPKIQLYGAGCFIRKSVWDSLESMGFELIINAFRGDYLISGEDSELCMAIRLLGYELWYQDDMIFYHWMPEQRMQWEYYLKLKEGGVKGGTMLYPYAYLLSYGASPLLGFIYRYCVKLINLYAVLFYFNLKRLIKPNAYLGTTYEIGKVLIPLRAKIYRQLILTQIANYRKIRLFFSK